MSRARTIVVGDVHGCLEELEALLGEVGPRDGDRLVFVGDLVDRGPDSVGVIRRVRGLLRRHPGSVCVCGNHEATALRKRERAEPPPWGADATDDDWSFLRDLPLFARLPDLGVLVVHGGLHPSFFDHHRELGEPPLEWHRGGGKRMDRMRRFLRVRRVDAAGEMVALGDERAGSVHWTARYDGREGYCFFGHDPQLDPPTPLVADHAMGLDTGACFGGALTAAIVEPGSHPRDAKIVRVQGSRYAEPREQWRE